MGLLEPGVRCELEVARGKQRHYRHVQARRHRQGEALSGGRVGLATLSSLSSLAPRTLLTS
eukprot:15452089-Alexandrium_andersonii.AAC.1